MKGFHRKKKISPLFAREEMAAKNQVNVRRHLPKDPEIALPGTETAIMGYAGISSLTLGESLA